jgi:transcriptional regulator with XRE-family HTH domain
MMMMKDSMDRHLVQIAERIHRWRDEAGYTLQELADRSGVAASTVHKIEKNQTVPTILVLIKICSAMKRRPDELLVQDSPEIAAALRRKGDHLIVPSDDDTAIEQLSFGIANSTIDVWRVRHIAGYGSGPESRVLKHKGEFIVLCEEGELTFYLGGEEYRIEAGDSLHFKTDVHHRWMNHGKTTASAIFFGTIPKGLHKSMIDLPPKKPNANARAKGVIAYADEKPASAAAE